MFPRSSKRQASFCGCSLFTPASGGKYGGLPVMRSNFSPARRTAGADFIAVGQSVVTRRFFGKRNALTLRFNRDKFRAGQSPRANHADRANAAAEVERRARGRAPSCAIRRRQNVVGGKTMSVAQLKQSEMSADGI